MKGKTSCLYIEPSLHFPEKSSSTEFHHAFIDLDARDFLTPALLVPASVDIWHLLQMTSLSPSA
jgi:hypothetical protein